MGEFVDPATIHDPAAGTVAPASWGDAVRDAILSSPHLLDEQIPGSDVASITFSIGQTPFRHLKLIETSRGSTAANAVGSGIRFNGDASAIYDSRMLRWYGTVDEVNSAAATSGQVCDVSGANATASGAGMQEILIPNYTNTTWHKGYEAHGGLKEAANAITGRHVIGFWRNTAAITSITRMLASGNFKAGSIFSLDGVP